MDPDYVGDDRKSQRVLGAARLRSSRYAFAYRKIKATFSTDPSVVVESPVGVMKGEPDAGSDGDSDRQNSLVLFEVSSC